MKKKLLIAGLFVILLLAGCGGTKGDTTPSPTGTTDNGENGSSTSTGKFTFIHNNVKMTPNQLVDSIISALGSDYNYYESDSCAYIGLDKVYEYKGFTIYTYPDSKAADHILTIVLTDDSVSTAEGIKLGDSLEKVKEIYGSDFIQLDGSIAYVRGDYKLSLIIKDGKVYSIVYGRKDDV